jgi:oxaloacetate decarboxylase gamma subunit
MAEAFKLMLTGMSTVFLILIFVVLLGHLIVRITNKFGAVPLTLTENSNKQNKNVESSKLAAIIAAVEVATLGNGKIASIQKVNEK